MKVLLANKFFFLNGGSETVFFQERDFLLSQGAQVVDFSMDDARNFPSPYSAFFVSKVDYHAARGTSTRFKQGMGFVHSIEAVERIDQIIHEEKPDIAHLHNIYHQLTPAIIPVLKKRGVKVVLTLHDGKLICPSYVMLNKAEICTACRGQYFWRPVTKGCQQSLTKGLLLMLEAYWHKWKGSYQLVDLFIAPSQFMANLVSQRIPEGKIGLLKNGINLDEFEPTYEDDGYGLFFGRLSREKGVETLLKTHQSMSGAFALKIVGTGPDEDHLRRKFRNGEFLGYKEGRELRDIIAKSAFVVVPSEWYENCSMVVLEAMAMGKPVVGSRIGGIPEQIDDGRTGLLFEMGNVAELSEKLKYLVENPNKRKEMGSLARKKVELTYSLESHCIGLMNIYRELLRA